MHCCLQPLSYYQLLYQSEFLVLFLLNVTFMNKVTFDYINYIRLVGFRWVILYSSSCDSHFLQCQSYWNLIGWVRIVSHPFLRLHTIYNIIRISFHHIKSSFDVFTLHAWENLNRWFKENHNRNCLITIVIKLLKYSCFFIWNSDLS